MAQREDLVRMPAVEEHLQIAGMLTGATAHELNNILGILSLRLEKLQDDRQARAPEPAEVEFAAGQARDLSVMERNLERAVQLIGELQGFLRSGEDAELIEHAGAAAVGLAASLELQQSIYERKIMLELPATMSESQSVVSVRPFSRGLLQALVVALFQRVVRTLGYGTELVLSWEFSAQSVALVWSARAVGTPPTGAAVLPGGDAILAQLVEQSEELTRGLSGQPLEWALSESEDPESGLPVREVRAVLYLPTA